MIAGFGSVKPNPRPLLMIHASTPHPKPMKYWIRLFRHQLPIASNFLPKEMTYRD
jgi:hypothetical protein